MSSSQPYQCVSCRLKKSIWQSRNTLHRRQFHASTPSQARKRPFPSIKASDLEQPQFRPYTAREKQLLALKYTPEQLKIVEAGEEAISAQDMAQQGRMRTDPLRIKYLDDFATSRPVLDRPLEAKDMEVDEEELEEGVNESGRGRRKKGKKDEKEKGRKKKEEGRRRKSTSRARSTYASFVPADWNDYG